MKPSLFIHGFTIQPQKVWWQLFRPFLLLLALSSAALGQSDYATPYTFTTLAGQPGVSGTNDGTGSAAQFYGPNGVAVDSAGNIYVADFRNERIRRVTPTGVVTTLAGSSVGYANGTNGTAQFNYPLGVAVDSATNLYVADYNNNAIRKVTPLGTNWVVTTLAGGSLGNNDGTGTNAQFDFPIGLALDTATNLYVVDEGYGTFASGIRKVTPAGVVTTLAGGNGSGSAAQFYNPTGVGVDNATNLYVADNGNSIIRKVTPLGTNWVVSTIAGVAGHIGSVDGAGISAQFNQPNAVAVDSATNLYVPDQGNNTIRKLTLFGNTWAVTTLAGKVGVHGTNDGTGTNAQFNYPAGVALDSAGNLYVADVNNQTIRMGFQAGGSPPNFFFSLWSTNRLEGPTMGSDSVVLAVAPNFAFWTATVNAPWLHLSQANVGGVGSTNVVFSFDANPGATRSGTLTIAGLTLTVTQAGTTYVAAQPVTTLVSSSLSSPGGLAVNGAGNVYIADTSHSAIKVWTLANNTVTTLVSSGLHNPEGVAVDDAGNIYIADTGDDAIKEWSVANSNVTSLVTSSFDSFEGVAVDGAGNVYIGDSGDVLNPGDIDRWTAANSNVNTLVSSGLNSPYGVAVDGASNVYFADTGNNAIKEWITANNTVITLATSGLSGPKGVAMDGAGNVYIADTGNSVIRKWSAASNMVTTLVSSGLSNPSGVAVDGAGNVYIADTGNYAIKELPYAFVDPTPKLETAAAGSDALPAVLPTIENLLAPFAPTSDQSWLTITGIANGMVSFSFTDNTGPDRTAHITLLGQSIPITQGVIGTPSVLTGVQMLGNGAFQFSFTNNPSASFTVVSTTNLSLPLSNWTVVGTASNIGSGVFQFTSQPMTNNPQLFYGVRSP